MQWYYSNDGRPQGPLAEADFQALVRAGTITPETAVWREGLEAWVPLKALLARGDILPAPGKAQCSQCRLWFAPDDVLRYEGQAICAECKPVFFQKVKEGVAVVDIGLWHYQHHLVADITRAEFPDRCVRCNRPAEGFRYPMRLASSLNITFREGFKWYKPPPLSAGLCPWHRSVRNLLRKLALCFAVVLLLLVLMTVIAALLRSDHVAGLAVGTVVSGILALILWAGSQALTQSSGLPSGSNFVLLRGAGRKFLDSLPEWRPGR